MINIININKLQEMEDIKDNDYLIVETTNGTKRVKKEVLMNEILNKMALYGFFQEKSDQNLNTKSKIITQAINSLNEAVMDQNTAIDNIINNGVSENDTNKLSYFSTSNVISNTKTPTDFVYKHMQWQGIDQTLIIMVNMKNKTDTAPQMMDNTRITDCIMKAKSYGIKTVMLKPHLGINWSDSTKRYHLDLGDKTELFLTNWKAILLNYAEICNKNNIPVLCIGCEQSKMVVKKYKDNWDDIINTIKGMYPNLLLTYAFDSGSGMMSDDNCIFTSDIDFVGLNLYPQWYPKVYNDNLTYKDLMPSAYNAYAPWSNGYSFIQRIIDIYIKYNKEIYITEIGVMPYDDGLLTLISEYAENKEADRNYKVSAIVYESIFNTYAKNPYVKGIALWAMGHPFCYFDYDKENVINYSEAEEVIKKYISEGDLVC